MLLQLNNSIKQKWNWEFSYEEKVLYTKYSWDLTWKNIAEIVHNNKKDMMIWYDLYRSCWSEKKFEKIFYLMYCFFKIWIGLERVWQYANWTALSVNFS